MKIIACAIGFGLGPSGKLCSIIEDNMTFEWLGCGDVIDNSIFQDNPFVDCCWSRDKLELYHFIKKHSVKYAIVVLDPELAMFFLEHGIKVVYVDSLPFMWTKNDVIPATVDYYCAQNYPGRVLNPVLDGVKNLVWINPIFPSYYTEETSSRIVINFGGLHSPFGDGSDYFSLIMRAILPCLNNENVIVVGGKNVVMLAKSLYPNIACATYTHKDFLNLVSSAELFITSPGLTTIYETYSLNIKTIILPPQNLSQFYNLNIAKKICHEVLALDWNDNMLNERYLARFCDKPEEETVRFIYNRIRTLSSDNRFVRDFSNMISNTIDQNCYVSNNTEPSSSNLPYISDILYKMIEDNELSAFV